MGELTELREMHEQLVGFAQTIKRVEIVLIGDEFNKNGIVQVQEQMRQELKEIKEYQIQQKTGISLGKWVIGTSLGAFLLSQFGALQHYIKDFIK